MKKKHRKVRWPVVLAGGFLLLAGLVWGTLKLTESGPWTVLMGTDDEVAVYHHFIFAKEKMNSYEANEPICIKDPEGRIVAQRSGVVNFNTKEEGMNTAYTWEGGEGYLNGAMTGLGLYLDSNGKQVKFQVAGVTGWVDVNDVDLTYWYPTTAVPTYLVSEGKLLHTVSNAYGRNSYVIGPAPDFLSPEKTWYSFDGHWFYDSFDLLSQDVRGDSHENAVNETAWYNPYQFASHRSLSSLTNVDYDSWLFRVKGIHDGASDYPCESWQSVLYNTGGIFNEVQEQTWINGAMMYAAAVNESGYGQSQLAIDNHNLFGHNALDATPDAAYTYPDLAACIRSHALDFLQKHYCNPEDPLWHGSWFGDKNSGINVSYASDPYWGEKAASFLYQLNWQPEMEIKAGQASYPLQVYSAINGQLLYTFPKGEDYSFMKVGEEQDGWTPVMSEAPVVDEALDVQAQYTDQDIVWVRIPE